MAQQTLLQIVQSVLSHMGSDEVNSISDTIESMMIANIVKDKYNDIVARGTLTIDETLFQLFPSDDPTKPTLMYLPDGVARIDWLQYFDSNPLDNTQVGQFGAYRHDLNTDLVATINWTTTSSTTNTITPTGTVTFTVASALLPITTGQTVTAIAGTASMFGNVTSYIGTTLKINVTSSTGSGSFSSWIIQNVNVPNSPPGYKYVDIVPVDYFLDVTNRFDITQQNTFQYTFTQGGNNFTFRYKNNHQPSICCVLTNFYMLFDTFDITQDSTLQASKTLAYGQYLPAFQLTDSFVPALDDIQFPLLLNESISQAFFELKERQHVKADQEIQRQWAVVQKTKSKDNKPGYFDQLANYGRVPRTGGYGGYPLWRWMRNSIGNAGV